MADSSLRIQARPARRHRHRVLGRVAGYPHSNLPKEIVMSAADMVDAALVGLERGEVITIPPLQDVAEWDRWEAARKAMSTRLCNATPAPRYAKA